ncbi:MAG: very short patch repair endonuclease [Thermodesulfobacteriota bacterium]
MTSDVFDAPTRSRVMRSVKGKNTRPEKAVRSLLHAMGYRFRLHRQDLPGSPDVVLPGRRAAIFVHGCFWHGHDCKRGDRPPKTNAEYWRRKRAGNVARDRERRSELEALGWRVLVIWECEVKDAEALGDKLRTFLGTPGARAGRT